jgi:hypothetical protein
VFRVISHEQKAVSIETQTIADAFAGQRNVEFRFAVERNFSD